MHVTVFGVQQSLDFVQVRLCLSDIGLAGFGSGEMRRKKTSVHIALPREVSGLIAVHGVVLASKAMRKAYVGVVSSITVEISARPETLDSSANLSSLCLTFRPRALDPLLTLVLACSCLLARGMLRA